MQMWNSSYPIDSNLDNRFPPLPPGAVLLSDEIIERGTSLPEQIVNEQYPRHKTRKTRQKIESFHSRMNSDYEKRNRERLWGNQIEDNEVLNSCRWSENYNKNSYNHGVKYDSYLQRKLDKKRQKKLAKKMQYIQDETRSSDECNFRLSSNNKTNEQLWKQSFNDVNQSLPRTYLNHSDQNYTPTVQRSRAASESAISQIHEVIVPKQLEDHAMKDKTRSMSRRKAIKISENLMCVPGIERIIEKRFYIKRVDNNSSSISITNASDQNTLVPFNNSKNNMHNLFDDVKQIKNDIQMLQRKHSELRDQTRNAIPTFSKSKDDAIVQTDMDTDSSRLNLMNGNYSPLQKSHTLYSSDSSDETIKNLNIASMSKKDIPMDVSKNISNSNITLMTVTDQSDKNDSSLSSCYSELKIVNHDAIKQLEDSHETNVVRQNEEPSNNTRVFKVEPPSYLANQPQHHMPDFNSPPKMPIHPLTQKVDQNSMHFNTWPEGQNPMNHQITQNFNTFNNKQFRNNANILNQNGNTSDYANVLKDAYGVSTNDFETSMKSLPTATISYAANEYDQYNTIPHADNVFSLVEPALSYQDNSFQVDNTSRFNHEFVESSQSFYNDSRMIDTIPRNTYQQSTFEDFVHQYNAVSKGNKTLPTRAYTNNISLQNQQRFPPINHQYENFIC